MPELNHKRTYQNIENKIINVCLAKYSHENSKSFWHFDLTIKQIIKEQTQK